MEESGTNRHADQLGKNAKSDRHLLLGCMTVTPAFALALLPVLGLLSLFPFNKPAAYLAFGLSSAILSFVAWTVGSRAPESSFLKIFGYMFALFSGSFTVLFLLLAAGEQFGF